jgi:hypothetical protein
MTIVAVEAASNELPAVVQRSLDAGSLWSAQFVIASRFKLSVDPPDSGDTTTQIFAAYKICLLKKTLVVPNREKTCWRNDDFFMRGPPV